MHLGIEGQKQSARLAVDSISQVPLVCMSADFFN